MTRNPVQKERLCEKKTELNKIGKSFQNSRREKILHLLRNLEEFWKIREDKEERFLELFEKISKEKFPFHKMIIAEHRQLKGHWKILNDF